MTFRVRTYSDYAAIADNRRGGEIGASVRNVNLSDAIARVGEHESARLRVRVGCQSAGGMHAERLLVIEDQTRHLDRIYA